MMTTIMDLMFPQPEHYWADVEVANFFSCPKSTQPIGCGPFKFVEYKVGDYLAMEAFEDFWNGRPYLDRAFIKITGGTDFTNIGFEAGEISAVTTTEDYYEEIKDDDRFQFLIGSSTNVAEVSFNLQIYKEKDVDCQVPLYTGDRVIREAIAYAVPFENIISKILRGACTRSYSCVPADCLFFTEEGLVRYEYDIEKANSILDAAGYVDTDGDGIRNWKDGSNITLLWSYFGAGGTNERMSILMAEECANIGILSGVKSQETTSWVDALLGGNEFDISKVETTASIYYYGGYGAVPYDYANAYASTGGQSSYIYWETGEVRPEAENLRLFGEETMALQAKVDDCFKRMNTTDEAVARAAFEEFQRIYTNEMIGCVPIGTMERRIAFQGNIRGIEDAIWFTNNNYLGFAMEKIWLEK